MYAAFSHAIKFRARNLHQWDARGQCSFQCFAKAVIRICFRLNIQCIRWHFCSQSFHDRVASHQESSDPSFCAFHPAAAGARRRGCCPPFCGFLLLGFRVMRAINRFRSWSTTVQFVFAVTAGPSARTLFGTRVSHSTTSLGVTCH